MKKKVFILFKLVLLLSANLSGQEDNGDTLRFNNYKGFVNYVTRVFKDNHPELSFFKHRVFPSFAPLNIYDIYNGQNIDSVYCNFLSYMTLVNCLDISNYNNDNKICQKYLQDQLISLTRKITSDSGFHSGNSPVLTPISLSFIEYSEFKDSTIALKYFGVSKDHLTENCPAGYYPFKKNKLFASSALNEIFLQRPINFFISENFILSNVTSKIDSIFIDFADGNGLMPILKDNVYPVYYSSNGDKRIQVKIKSDNSYYFSYFNIKDSASSGIVSRGNSNNSTTSGCSDDYHAPDEVRNINAGGVGGHYGIWFSKCGRPPGDGLPGKIRKPFILSGGFNPGNGKQLQTGVTFADQVINVGGVPITLDLVYCWRGTQYETSNGVWSKRFSPVEFKQVCAVDNHARYLDRLLDEGYDVIILMYDDGEQSIFDNAKVAKQLIKDINQEKMNNGFFFENVVSGNSAGSVATRYALAEMESEFKFGNGPNPHTKLWVSVEGEMQGANVPLGLQYFIDYQANPLNWVPFFIPPFIPGFSVGNLVLADIALKQDADHANTLIAAIAQSFNDNPTGNELTTFTSRHPNGDAPERANLISKFANIPGNNSGGYPEFCRRVGVSQGSSEGSHHQHTNTGPFNSVTMFDADMQYGIPNVQLPVIGGCGTFTCHFPHIDKRTNASYWSAANNGNLFTGYVYFDAEQTIFPAVCVSGNILGQSASIIYPETNIGIPFYTSYETQSKPSVTSAFNAVNTTNYDDPPSSSLAAHTELSSIIYDRFYNTFVANVSGLTYSHSDPLIHAFAPTASCLDLRDPNHPGQSNDTYVSPVSMGLMFNRVVGGVPLQEPNNRYGFPHLKHPANHYAFTPFDGVYAIGDNNGNQLDFTVTSNSGQMMPRPNNQFHIEDPQSMIGDYLARVEIAPTDLFLSDRTIDFNATNITNHSQYVAEFESRNKITVGNGIYPASSDHLTPDGDFIVNNGSKVILHSGDNIALLPGTSVFPGSELDAFHRGYGCSDALFRESNTNSPSKNNSGNGSGGHSTNTNLITAQNLVAAKKHMNAIRVYPNPNDGIVIIEKETEDLSQVIIRDVTGKLVYESDINLSGQNPLNLQGLENGVYLLEVNTGTSQEKFKIMVAK